MATNYYQNTSEDTIDGNELKLYDLIMAYRASLGLPSIPLSAGLTITAGRHVLDQIYNTGGYNAHAWSDAPYDGTAATFANMWDAPQRVASGYTGKGYEIATGYVGASALTVNMTPEEALASWKSSAPHNAVITSQSPWTQPWKAIGIAIHKGVADVWFGNEVDPTGAPKIDTSVADSGSASSAGASGPEITVLGNGVVIADGDTTPSLSDLTNFGVVAQGGTAVQRSFTVKNDGAAALTISGLSVPAGFSVVEGLSASIAPGQSDTFTVRLDTGAAGTRTGQISFANNDADENPFNFSISGAVNTAAVPLADIQGRFEQNKTAALGLAVAYDVLLGGVPTVDGFHFLIDRARATNFGTDRPDVVFNFENIFINLTNNLVQGNPAALANFNALTNNAPTLAGDIAAIYNAIVPTSVQTDAGRAFISRPDGIAFYKAVAAERGVAGDDGAAVVALSSLLGIVVRDNHKTPGVGADAVAFFNSVMAGSATVPKDGAVFTPIENADGVPGLSPGALAIMGGFDLI